LRTVLYSGSRVLGAALVVGCMASLLGCHDDSPTAQRPNAERFLGALDPAARDCVLGATSEERLDGVLSALTDLGQPRTAEEGLPHELRLLTTCTHEVNVRRGIARVILANLPRQRSRLMLAQEDTPDDEKEIRRRLNALPRQMRGLYRFHGFERRGPARLSVVYQEVDVPKPAQSLVIDLLTHPGQHPLGWSAGEIVAMTAFDAGESLVGAGVYHGLAWARLVVREDDRAMQVITWGDVEGPVLFRAQGATRDALHELLEAFRAGA
jgi:hypothetical protein